MSASAPRILVAGVGNIFLGDDAFGVEVIRALLTRPPMENVRIADFGIRGLDLAYALLEGYDCTILIDAVPRGGIPGTLYTLEPEIPAATSDAVDLHGMAPVQVLRLASRLGRPSGRLFLVGCEPSPVAANVEFASGLSLAVSRAVAPAAERVLALIEEVRSLHLASNSKG